MGVKRSCRGLFQRNFVLFARANKKIYINFSRVILLTLFGTTNVVDTKSHYTAVLGNCVLVVTWMCTVLTGQLAMFKVLCLNKRHYVQLQVLFVWKMDVEVRSPVRLGHVCMGAHFSS
jgi:hypothetical protein